MNVTKILSWCLSLNVCCAIKEDHKVTQPAHSGHSWKKHQFSFNPLGLYGYFEGNALKVNYAAEAGYEYGWYWGKNKNYYFGVNTLFNLFYPDSLSKNTVTILGPNIKVYPFLIPIINLNFGYIPQAAPNHKFILGSTYLWGLTLEHRYLLTPNVYTSFRGIWWLDKILFKQGLHNFYFTMGIGFQF